MPSVPIDAPAGFVPEHAMAFAAGDGTAAVVGPNTPLPVAPTLGAASAAPLAGSTSASVTVGPFAPQLARAIWVTLAGTWTGSVQLLRSNDGGATKLALTYPDGTLKATWSGNANTPAAEETVAGATYYLGVTLSAGTLAYRVEQ